MYVRRCVITVSKILCWQLAKGRPSITSRNRKLSTNVGILKTWPVRLICHAYRSAEKLFKSLSNVALSTKTNTPQHVHDTTCAPPRLIVRFRTALPFWGTSPLWFTRFLRRWWTTKNINHSRTIIIFVLELWWSTIKIKIINF